MRPHIKPRAVNIIVETNQEILIPSSGKDKNPVSLPLQPQTSAEILHNNDTANIYLKT